MKPVLTIALCACSALTLPLLTFPAGAADGAKLQVSEKDPFGAFLTDAEGRSLYLFEADSKNTATCYDDCANAWPPLLTEGAPGAGQQVDAAMLSTIKRQDGSTQVTYNGWPLYYFVKDQAPGDTNGQDVEGFGAEWYLISPKGEKVED
jgi:predicted lipoprotein with Yx(FWY)xxD motif